jgi:hypothetical protein
MRKRKKAIRESKRTLSSIESNVDDSPADFNHRTNLHSVVCASKCVLVAGLLQTSLRCLHNVSNGLQNAFVVESTESHALRPAHLNHQSVAFVLVTKLRSRCTNCVSVLVGNDCATLGALPERTALETSSGSLAIEEEVKSLFIIIAGS